MNNKITLENPMRKTLKIGIIILAIYCAIFLALFITVSLGNRQNFNGETKEIDGIVEKVVQNDNQVYFLYLEGNETKFTTTPVQELYNWESLQGKSVTLVIPQKQIVVVPSLVLGLSVDGEKVIDAQETIVRKSQDKTPNYLFVISLIVGIATCALIIVRVYTPITKQFSLAQKYAEFYAVKQPIKNLGGAIWCIFGICGALLIALTTVVGIIGEKIAEADQLLFIVLTIVSFVIICVGWTISMVVLNKRKSRQNILFYSENFPFDFTNIQHIPMKKEAKQQLEKELKETVENHPHDYGDGGNGYLVQFTETGVQLFVEDFYNEETLDAQNVFDVEENTPVMQLSYSQLNFEALPIYNVSNRPLFVVIKSRLEKDDSFPEEFENDLHFLLDSNLLHTLRTFNVPVECLDYILQNKQKLMTENCYKKHKKSN